MNLAGYCYRSYWIAPIDGHYQATDLVDGGADSDSFGLGRVVATAETEGEIRGAVDRLMDCQYSRDEGISIIPPDRPAGEPAPEAGAQQSAVLEGAAGGLPTGEPGSGSGLGHVFPTREEIPMDHASTPPAPKKKPTWLLKEVQLIETLHTDLYRISFVNRNTGEEVDSDIQL